MSAVKPNKLQSDANSAQFVQSQAPATLEDWSPECVLNLVLERVNADHSAVLFVKNNPALV
jgi:hypothetical protein